MNLKKVKTIGIFVTFALCFINHFIYDFFPNFIFSIFFPVNESVWEHMKMLTTSILMWQFIEYFILKKYGIKYSNFILSCFVMCTLSIVIFLLIYYPIYSLIGENFILNITCLFITIFFVSIIGYYIMKSSYIKYEKLGIVGLIILYLTFAYLTYNTPKLDIFYDSSRGIYSVPN